MGLKNRRDEMDDDESVGRIKCGKTCQKRNFKVREMQLSEREARLREAGFDEEGDDEIVGGWQRDKRRAEKAAKKEKKLQKREAKIAERENKMEYERLKKAGFDEEGDDEIVGGWQRDKRRAEKAAKKEKKLQKREAKIAERENKMEYERLKKAGFDEEDESTYWF